MIPGRSRGTTTKRAFGELPSCSGQRGRNYAGRPRASIGDNPNRDDPETGEVMDLRRRDVQESMAGGAEGMLVGPIQAAQPPMLGERVFEFHVEVGYPGGTTWFRNAAVEAEGHGFLATLEPTMEPEGTAESQRGPSANTLRQ